MKSAALFFSAISVCSTVLCGCAPDEDARDVWLRSTLVSDKLDLLRREPEQVAAQWSRMASDPFQFLRGSASWWARDATAPGGEAAVPTCISKGAAAATLLVGDPHPENFGTYLPPDGILTFDLNDFDAARVGPVHLDVRRLALSFAVALAPIDHELALDAAEEVALGWVDGLDGNTRVAPAAAPGHFVSALFAKAAEKGEERAELLELTHLEPNGRRALNRLTEPPVAADAEYALEVDAALRRSLDEGLASWSSAAGLRPPVDVVRVFGKGVGTRAHLRFRALLADGGIVEAKEARDPFELHAFTVPQPRAFTDNAERVVQAEEAMHSVPRADGRLGWFTVGELSFVVHGVSGWQRTLRTSSLREELGAQAATPRDVRMLAALCGRVLGAAHARASPQSLVVGHAERTTIAEETRAFVAGYLPTAIEDASRLERLLDRFGPQLGFVP